MRVIIMSEKTANFDNSIHREGDAMRALFVRSEQHADNDIRVLTLIEF